MKVALLTFGCRVNHAESLALERELRARGADVVPAHEADVVFVNSCTVTATADQGTRQSVRRIARENPSARIVVTGCYATRSPEDVRALPGVAAVIPNARKDRLLEELPPFAIQHSNIPSSIQHPASSIPLVGAGRTAFTLRVQTGCDEPCAYCIIPSTRGEPRSTPPGDVVRELQRVEAAGFKEVTLTGVHLGAYGRDLPTPVPLHALLTRAIEGTRGLVLRLGSLEPMDCTPELLDLAAATDRLAPAFHRPLQHASDRILAAMRRPYTLAQYEASVTALRARLSHAAIGSDIIVGFPGETDDDWRVLHDWLSASPLTSLHVFPYSDRPGTEASSLRGAVHGAVIRSRAAGIRAVGQRLHERFRAAQTDRVHRALTIEDGSTAVTGIGLKVAISPRQTRNQWVRVRLGPLDATVESCCA